MNDGVSRGEMMIDIRSHPEAQYVGIPEGLDGMVAWSNPDLQKWDIHKGVLQQERNVDFVAQVEAMRMAKDMEKRDLVVLLCRSGDRSSKAADALAKAGYTQLVSVVDGLEGDLNDKTGQRDLNPSDRENPLALAMGRKAGI